ncbi:MAG: SpvB/TcaC N-terminal domain-containing protein [Myxococcota bacterium]
MPPTIHNVRLTPNGEVPPLELQPGQAHEVVVQVEGDEDPQAMTPEASAAEGGVSLPKLGEKFSVNPVMGTGSASIGFGLPPGRTLTPGLGLGYDSSGENGCFGLGWALGVPYFARATTRPHISASQHGRGVPTYDDAAESDVFIFSDAAELLKVEEVGTRDGHTVTRYRPRLEAGFARIERWEADGISHWRVTDASNVTSIFGAAPEACVVDPEDPTRVFRWNLQAQVDPLGNVVLYQYTLDTAAEPGRAPGCQSLLTRVLYANRAPLADPLAGTPDDFLFEVLLDYKPVDSSSLDADDDPNAWHVRPDAFSYARPGFEVRTRRLCHGVRVIHRFSGGEPTPVSRTELAYDEDPIASRLVSATFVGIGDDGELALPARTFTYSDRALQATPRTLPANAFPELDLSKPKTDAEIVDLDGNAVAGLLVRHLGSFYWHRRIDALRYQPPEKLQFGASAAASDDPHRQRLFDLDLDGRPALVELGPAGTGQVWERNADDDGWAAAVTLPSVPPEIGHDPEAQAETGFPRVLWGDLDGDGRSDALVVMAASEAPQWWRFDGVDNGWIPQESADAMDPEATALLQDPDALLLLADITGDGLPDLVNINPGEVAYWPGLGHGRFGKRVSVKAPNTSLPTRQGVNGEAIDPTRLRVFDVEGTGGVDILVLGDGTAQLWINRCGNAFEQGPSFSIPGPDDLALSSLTRVDGRGTASFVFAEAKPGAAVTVVDFVPGEAGAVRPMLLVAEENGIGLRSRIEYTPSTSFLPSPEAGSWVTRLPFCVPVVTSLESEDGPAGMRFASSLSYGHGCWDGREREFRGFGFVEQRDAEDFANNKTQGSDLQTVEREHFSPPIRTRSWFHTGVVVPGSTLTDAYRPEYSDYDPHVAALSEAVGAEPEAVRALKGVVLHTESYVEARPSTNPKDDAGKQREQEELERVPRPFSITEHGYRLEPSAQHDGEHHSSLLLVAEQTLSYSYDRKETPDPRVSHSAVLEVDDKGSALETITVAYPRRQSVPEPSLPGGPVEPPVEPAGPADDVRVRLVGFVFDEAKNFILPEARAGLRALAEVYADHAGSSVLVVGHTDRVGQSDDNDALSLSRAQSVAAFLRDDVDAWLEMYEPHVGAPEQWGATEDAYMLEAIGYAEAAAFRGAHGLGDGPLDRAARAMLVGEYMAFDGTTFPPGAQLETVGAGEHYPKVETADGVDEPENRRVEVFFFRDGVEPPVPGSILSSGGSEHAAWVGAMGETLDVSAASGFVEPKLEPGAEPPPPADLVTPEQPDDDPQLRTEVVRTEVKVVHRDSPEDYLVGAVLETASFAVAGASGDSITPFSVGALRAATGGELLSRSRVHYFDDEVVGPVDDLGSAPTQVGRTGMVHSTQTAAFSEAQFVAALGDDPRAREALQDSKYLFGEDLYWVPSGTTVHAKADGFFLATSAVDAFGNAFTTTYDADHYFAVETKDAYDNVATSKHDHRTLAPVDVVDPNGAKTFFAYDALGRLTKTWGEGRHGEGTTEGSPAQEHSYDLSKTPISRRSKIRHDQVNTAKGRKASAKLQTVVTYYGGSGAPLQTRVLIGGSKFRVPGRSQVNNKGKPVRSFEPSVGGESYSSSAGPSASIVRYDELGRAVRTEHRDGTVERVDFDMWGSVAFDRNDTAVEEEVELEDGVRADDLALHADTPTHTRLDVLGRPVAVFQELRDETGHSMLVSRSRYDLAGNVAEVIDARGNVAEKRRFGLGGLVLQTRSLDAGVQASLPNIDGTMLYARRGEVGQGASFTSSYDELRRPITDFVQPDAGEAVAIKHRVYVDTKSDVSGEGGSADTYHHGRLLRVYDGGGVLHFREYDFDGNPVLTERVLPRDATARPNWSALADLKSIADLDAAAANDLEDGRVFATSRHFDAMGRAVEVQSDLGSSAWVHRQTFTEEGRLASVSRADASTPDDAEEIHVVEDYDTFGRPTTITRGAVTTTYSYDAKTQRLRSITSKAGSKVLQALAYAYDPVGNVVRIKDGAYKAVVVNGEKVEAATTYRYDSLYRLVEAKGREHTAQVGSDPGRSAADTPALRHGSPHDANDVRGYTQRYSYDAAGNLLRLQHGLGVKHSAARWTRRYAYSEHGNRLRATAVSNDLAPQVYPHDAFGRFTAMPHLDAMEWDELDQLQRVDRGSMQVFFQYVDGARIRKWTVKGGRTEERVYAGGGEEFRVFTGSDPLAADNLQEHTTTEHAGGLTLDTKHVRDGASVAAPKALYRYRLGNHLGSTSLEVDETGGVISYEEYHPYGTTAYRAVRSGIDVDVNRYRFTGMEKDEETGLAQHGWRYFASWLGRWCSADPIGLGDGLNRFAYCGGNPASRVDREGTKTRRPTENEHSRYSRDAATHNSAVALWHAQVQTFDLLSDDALANARNLEIERQRLIAAENELLGRYVDLAEREFLATVETIRDSNREGGPEFLNLSESTLRRLHGATMFAGGTSSALLGIASGGTLGVMSACLGADFVQAGALQFATGEEHETVMRSGTALVSESLGSSVSKARVHGDMVETLLPATVGGLELAASVATSPTTVLSPLRRASGRLYGPLRPRSTRTIAAGGRGGNVPESAGGTNPWTSEGALEQVTGRTAQSRQRAIDAVLKEDLANVKMTHRPRYSPYARTGVASPPGNPDGTGTQIGKNVFSTRKDLVNTIIHEELHHRWWMRGIPSFHHSPDMYVPNEKFYRIIERFLRLKGF